MKSIEERAKEYANNSNTTPKNKLGRLQGYIKGATDQAEITKKEILDKVCQWLYKEWAYNCNTPVDELLIDDLRKAMEE